MSTDPLMVSATSVSGSSLLRRDFVDSGTSTDPFPQLVELPPAGTVSGRDELERVRAHAFEQGYQAGFAQGVADGSIRGERDGAATAASRVDGVLAEIAASAARARADDALVGSSLSAALVDVALQIAEAVVGHEVASSASPGREALERALRFAPADGHLVARLHPDDARLVDVSSLAGSTSRRHIEIVADPEVERGGCLLETPDGCIDALLSTALVRVAAALAAGDGEELAA